MTPTTPTSPSSTLAAGRRAGVHRIEVWRAPGRDDPRAAAVLRRAQARGFGVKTVRTARVYLIEAALDAEAIALIRGRLLADPVAEQSQEGARGTEGGTVTIEVHPLPGVMDPAAQSVREAISALLGVESQVSTGLRYDLEGVGEAEARLVGEKLLANPVINQISVGAYQPRELPHGHGYAFRLKSVAIRDLSDEQLVKMSREAHLFLSLEEMRAVRAEFRRVGREPTDIELETIAQTWSEHCVHKTLKSDVRYSEEARVIGTGGREEEDGGKKAPAPDGRLEFKGRPGHTVNADGSVSIRNLLKSTVAAATHELIGDGVDWALSVFKDNSGVIEFDESFGVNIKVETHNRPSAIEPYGGAATGAGGCIRDVIGTGLGARPIANTDVFCVARPDAWRERDSNAAGAEELPPGVLHPRRVLTDVVAGVKDYGNRMGIPTVNGAVYFDDRYVGNPLVFCGCVGLIPRGLIKGQARAGDRIIAMGGRTGRDGIHGATFSSAELEQGHSTEFAHAVQIGNAIEEKRLLDAILRARDYSKESAPGSTPAASGRAARGRGAEGSGGPLFSAITDCGAGGFSSAIGEMGGELGACVQLEGAPLKYAGLSYTEIWISEAQERMILAVPAENVALLRRICEEEGVEIADLGYFGTPGAELILRFGTTEVGRLSMHFLHEGIPMPTREAVWRVEAKAPAAAKAGGPGTIAPTLRALLAHPTIASKHWLVRMYDHEVQGNTVVKPLAGVREVGPSDGSVVCPVAGSARGVALACGLAPGIGDVSTGGDPYQMALAGIDEAVRNLVCVGADPARMAILDNFCWPSCDDPRNMGALVRACAGCYDGAKAYRAPFVSGKDSLNNQLRYTDPASGEKRVIEIPYTLLITGMGIVHDASRCVTMDAKRAGNVLVLIGQTQGRLGGSVLSRLEEGVAEGAGIPRVDLRVGPATARVVADLIQGGLVQAAHDVSDGGVLASIAEMLVATCARPGDVAADVKPLGAELMVKAGDGVVGTMGPRAWAFCESPSRYVLEVREEDLEAVVGAVLRCGGLRWAAPIARLNESGRLQWKSEKVDEKVEELRDVWMGTLDW